MASGYKIFTNHISVAYGPRDESNIDGEVGFSPNMGPSLQLVPILKGGPEQVLPRDRHSIGAHGGERSFWKAGYQ